jgi:Xaa-Pro aminopeptidase
MDRREFARRRKRLQERMGGGIALVPSAPVSVRNRDIEYPYRQDSDFYYLTGFPEPDALAVFAPGRPDGEFLLFCRERDPEKEVWTGRRVGLEGARDRYGADDAFPISELDDIVPGLLENQQRVYYTLGRHAELDQRVIGWVNQVRAKVRAGVHAPGEFVSLDPLLHELRLFKSPAEIKAMRYAARVSAAAHRRAMTACRPGMLESELEAELLHEFMVQGCRFPAYPPIVGGGANACVLHYTDNTDRLRAGDLVLIDAGGEYQHYAADITRTFPVSGRFSAPQRAVYELVLAAQLAAIDRVRPGSRWNEPHESAVRVLTQGMVDLGLLKGDVEQLIADETYRRFYMHRTGHWLGMDVHDVGDYKVGGQWRMLEAGMVLTVEPGIYIPRGAEGVSKKWWNIGVRIEDDVLVTKDGHEVLSADVPKAVEEIEELQGMRAGASRVCRLARAYA